MTKLSVQNYFTTELLSTVNNSILGEIELSLAVAPQSEVGFLIVDYLDPILREEIFYHRKAGTSVFTYGVNRINPQSHSISASVQLNDSASIFNYVLDITPDHFFMYKTSDNSMFIKGGSLFDNGNYYIIPNKTDLVFGIGTNYLYLDNQVIKSTTESIIDKFIFGDVIVNGAGVITDYNNYNTLALVTARTNKILRGAGVPLISIGIIGDYYIDDENKNMYGPKIEGDWGTYFSIRGIQGLKGDPGVQGPPGNIEEAPEGTSSTIKDNSLLPAGTVVDTDHSTRIRVTLVNGDYTEYRTTIISTNDILDNNYSVEIMTGVFGLYGIQYDSGLFVNKTTGYSSFTGNPMYKNQNNNVTGLNTFNGNSIFKGQVSFKYHTTNENLVYDANLGTKQGMNLSTIGAKTLTFTNLLDGVTLLLAMNVTGSSIDLNIGSAAGAEPGKSYIPYNMGSDTYPINLTTGTHIFGFEVFSTGIHAVYIGKSMSI